MKIVFGKKQLFQHSKHYNLVQERVFCYYHPCCKLECQTRNKVLNYKWVLYTPLYLLLLHTRNKDLSFYILFHFLLWFLNPHNFTDNADNEMAGAFKYREVLCLDIAKRGSSCHLRSSRPARFKALLVLNGKGEEIQYIKTQDIKIDH